MTDAVVGFLSGTFERQSHGRPVGQLAAVANRLPPSIVCQGIPYQAVYGNPVAYDVSAAGGRKAALAWLQFQHQHLDPSVKVFLVGYSQGAAIGGDVAAVAGADLLDGAVLLGDPRRHRDDHVGPRLRGWGVSGERRVSGLRMPVHQLAIPGDPIPDSSPDSFLRDIADATGLMSIRDPQAWVSNLLWRVARGEFQNHLKVLEQLSDRFGRTPARLIALREELDGYLRLHPRYNTTRMAGFDTYTDVAAQLIVRMAKP